MFRLNGRKEENQLDGTDIGWSDEDENFKLLDSRTVEYFSIAKGLAEVDELARNRLPSCISMLLIYKN